MTEPAKNNTPEIIRASLARRHRAEKRFRCYGIAAISFGMLAVVVLLVDIVSKGHGAFQQTYVQLEVHYDPTLLDIDDARDPAALIRGNFQAVVRAALRDRLGEGAEVSNLRIRLARGRATPKGLLYLEEGGPPEALPSGLYAAPEPVTHREFFAWFEQASGEGLVRPPRSWGGSRPPERLLDRPVDEVGAAEAKAYARAKGGRLPSAEERQLLGKALEREIPGPDAEGKRYPQGFFVVSDVR